MLASTTPTDTKGNTVFKRDYKERVALAAVLSALSAIPISVGLATTEPFMHFVWLAIGLVLWAAAIALLYPYWTEK